MTAYHLRNNKSYNEILMAIKESTPIKEFKQGMVAGHACRLLSPYCSVFFIKKGFSPNQVTLFMIGFGILGSVLFAIPNIWCKIVGYTCWFLWFTMDLSDGEVARTTKTFSKYGTEMDYMAHLIDHPFMNLALWLTFLSFNIIVPFILSLVFIISISMELFMRNVIAFQHYCNTNGNAKTIKMSYVKYFLTQILLYPNMIIMFTPVILIDCYLESGFSVYLYIIWFGYAFLMFIRSAIKQLLYFYRR